MYFVGKDARGEWGVCGVSDQAVHLVSEILVLALQDVWKVPRSVPLEPLQVQLDIPGPWAENVLVCL